MTKFYEKATTLNVSHLSPDGWWLGNGEEHVQAGTALGPDCTLVIFEPSEEGMTGRFDLETQQWTEVEDRTSWEYWSDKGVLYILGQPDGEYPDWAIKEAPPEHDNETEEALHKDDAWVIYKKRMGERYYDKSGNELIVSEPFFELPPEHTYTKPPECDDGFTPQLVDGKWQVLADHRGKVAYSKDRAKPSYQVKELGDLPAEFTLTEPGDHDSWDDDADDWKYDKERHRPMKALEEREWRDSLLGPITDKINQYLTNQSLPSEFRSGNSPTQEVYEALLPDYKALCDYPDAPDFPFGNRPVLANE